MELLASYCLTEPGSGSDAAALRTRAVRDGDHYVLNGQKQFISGAGGQRPLCRDGAHRRRRAAAASRRCVVEGGTPGLSFGANERKMGWNAQPTRAVIFENARVPVANRLGEEGIGFKIAMAGLDGGRINIAACSLGGAQSALDKSLAYMKERKAFGKRLDEFQALQFRIADMATELEAARTFVWRAAAALDRKDADATMLCAMAKRFGTDVGFDVANQALQLHGGYGYLSEYGIEKIVRDLRVHQILGRDQRNHAADRGAQVDRGRAMMDATTAAEPDLIVRREGSAGHHPAEPAESHQCDDARDVDRHRRGARSVRGGSAVSVVLLEGAGERGLCAGGDIRGLYDSSREGGDLGKRFWRQEYVMNARIAKYPKPYVAFMDGLVMGGGVGLSAHSSHRVVTERTKLAMPEVGLGFFPDVGGTWLLSRSPGELGTYFGLTGQTMNGPDAIHCRFADAVVPSEKLPALREVLTKIRPGTMSREVSALIEGFATGETSGPVAAKQSSIDALVRP